jgi:hypothetical protein
MNTRFKRFWIFFASAALTGGLLWNTLPTEAFDYEIGEEIAITQPVEDDFGALGGKVVNFETIGGDFMVIGGEVTVDNTVAGDLFAIGGRLEVRGDVADDVRAFGAEVRIAGTVGDDLIVRGGKVTIEPDAVVKGDLIVRGGRVELLGTVQGNVIAHGAFLNLGGTIEGNLKTAGDFVSLSGRIGGKTEMASREIELGKDVFFQGDVDYWQRFGEVNFDAVRHDGEIRLNPELKFNFQQARFLGPLYSEPAIAQRILLLGVLSGLLMILILSLLPLRPWIDTAKRLNEGVGMHFVRGLLYFLITPLAALLLMVSLIGLPLGLMVLGFYLLSVYLAPILTAMVLAQWTNRKGKYQWNKGILLGVSALFFLVLHFLAWVPFLGSVIVKLLACVVMGALLTHCVEHCKKMMGRQVD